MSGLMGSDCVPEAPIRMSQVEWVVAPECERVSFHFPVVASQVADSSVVEKEMKRFRSNFLAVSVTYWRISSPEAMKLVQSCFGAQGRV